LFAELNTSLAAYVTTLCEGKGAQGELNSTVHVQMKYNLIFSIVMQGLGARHAPFQIDPYNVT